MVRAGLGLAVAVAVADLLLTSLVGPTSRWLPHGEYPADRGVLTMTGNRLVGADRALRREGAESSSTLGVLLGQSTLECGLDPAALDADDGLAIRWLNLFGKGGSVHKIGDIVDLLHASGMRPSVAVFAINPYMLVGNDYRRIREAEIRATNNRIKPWVWTWENRILANHLVQMAIHDARVRLFRASGLGLAPLFAPEPSPWETPPVIREHRPAAELEDRLAYNRKIGWLDPRNYTTSGSNAVALADQIREFRAIGTEVVIVVLPLRSRFREALPPESRACLASIARDATPGRPVPIIDLEAALPDAMFLDLDHIDVEGRALCSRLLAARLRERLAGTVQADPGPRKP